MDLVRATVGNVHLCAVTAGVQAVRTDAGGNEARLTEGIAINHEHTIGMHVGHIEFVPVWRGQDILWHAAA